LVATKGGTEREMKKGMLTILRREVTESGLSKFACSIRGTQGAIRWRTETCKQGIGGVRTEAEAHTPKKPQPNKKTKKKPKKKKTNKHTKKPNKKRNLRCYGSETKSINSTGAKGVEVRRKLPISPEWKISEVEGKGGKGRLRISAQKKI